MYVLNNNIWGKVYTAIFSGAVCNAHTHYGGKPFLGYMP